MGWEEMDGLVEDWGWVSRFFDMQVRGTRESRFWCKISERLLRGFNYRRCMILTKSVYGDGLG